MVLVGLVDGLLVLGVIVFGCLSRVVGGLGGLRQTHVRVLLGYSSISHGGWLVVGGIYSISAMFVYFFIYRVINFILFFYLSIIETGFYGSLLKGFRSVGVGELQVLGLLLVVLAGLPPTIGFTIKWSVFVPVCAARFIVGGFLILGSLMGVYYYRCLVFCWYVFAFSKWWNHGVYRGLRVVKSVIVGALIVGGFVGFFLVRFFCI